MGGFTQRRGDDVQDAERRGPTGSLPAWGQTSAPCGVSGGAALHRSILFAAFNAAGGRWVWISNLDNVGAGVDLALLGQHIASEAPLTVELVDKEPGDQGGGPVLFAGRPIIAERRALARPRVLCFSSRVTWKDGHITP